MTTLTSVIVIVFVQGFSYCLQNESCVAGTVSLSVSVSTNSSLLVEWTSRSSQATQCALLISTEGKQEIQIHLLPRESGSLLLKNMTKNNKQSFLCTCFAQSQGRLCSKNISFGTGADTPAPVNLISDNQCSTSNINMRWLSMVFGATLTTGVILLIYIIYRRWTGNDIIRLRLR